MKKEDLTYDRVRAAFARKKYKFQIGEFIPNMVGIRSSNRKVDNWDDFFCLLYQEQGKNKIWVNDQFTTDPGIYYMQKKLLNPEGCGILAPGFYEGVWMIGLHGGKYEAFRQTGNKVKFYRDRNLDNIMDFDEKTLKEGFVGCNQHHGYDAKGGVNNNSAMCQVHRYKKDLAFVLDVAKKSGLKRFNYALFNESDI